MGEDLPRTKYWEVKAGGVKAAALESILKTDERADGFQMRSNSGEYERRSPKGYAKDMFGWAPLKRM